MKIKKMTAAALAAAVWAAAAPMTGVLPDYLSVSVSAAEFAVGDEFYVGIDREGNVLTEPDTNTEAAWESPLQCICRVKTENSIMVKLNAVRLNGGSITVPSSVGGFIVETVFVNKLNIESITIPDTVKILGNEAFLDCAYLTEVKFGANSQLEEIGRDTFKNCPSLKEITIPKSVTTIDPTAFDGSALTNINGTAGSYAETFAKENGYTFNGGSDSAATTTAAETDAPETSANTEAAAPETSANTEAAASETSANAETAVTETSANADSTPAPAASNDKNSPNTGVSGVAAAAGAAALAGVAAAIVRKMKK